MRSVYKVVPDGDRWLIKREGAFTPLETHGHKNEAVKAARDRAERDLPSRLIVLNTHGTVESDKLLGTDQLQRDLDGMREMEAPLPAGLETMPEMEDEPG